MELTADLISQNHPEKPEKLTSLELSKHSITTLCSLQPYQKLKAINLSSNFIESLENSSLEKLKDLKELDISCNSLTSLINFSTIPLVKLNLSFNRIEKIDLLPKVISNQTLQILRCEGNMISDTRSLSALSNLKFLDLSSNFIESLEGIENIQIEELYLNHNKLSLISPQNLPSALKILHLRGNSLKQLNFLSKITGLESLDLSSNELETLEDCCILPSLEDLTLRKNNIFMLGLKQEIHIMFPSLCLLDLSQNSLYDRFELISLKKISSLFELDLTENPCAEDSDFIENIKNDYPDLVVINGQNISKNNELSSRPVSRSKTTSFDDVKTRKEVKELSDFIVLKRKNASQLLKEIDRVMEKQFYDEFELLNDEFLQKEKLFVVREEKEDLEHEDLELEEQKWFNTQMEWTKRVSERKGATHRYIKDDRPVSSKGKDDKNVVTSARGTGRHRKKLEEAIRSHRPSK